ncbi:NHL domain-containing thioredoxin family protein [Amycolatopsis sp., V23-08]|uniref:NHL domain-containing thioredoxin family protein n=1 Tax=Amycolatopsis heterodermiae TaxID=3110235 RepID=A0ABU5R1U7_9PSEU|nr:NHL domain-containing thioredoxin family protein [Amycolatopsis sp., V23-08]MEA5359679.1 NHL domain-containing thioredoxin family protein [Amycolatopsis sp., V23-08]
MRAPELRGDVWLNTGGRPITLAELRGRIVLLDFWTSGCVNCLHVLDELRPLEAEFADVLVTIGVHSPKFLHEGERASIEAAVRRYEVHHPVVNDPKMELWSQYAVRAWPTLAVVDPEGYVVHVAAGEGHEEALRRVIADLVKKHEAKGTLRRGGSPYVPVEEQYSELRFPSKAVATAEGRILVADTGHHSVVEFASDGETVIRRFGSGERGGQDGPFDIATFTEPSGIALLPYDVAERAGYHAVVADTAGHRLRGLDLITGEVTTVAGTGAQWRNGPDAGKGVEVDLTSPWDVAWWGPAGGVVVAMAGNHTLSVFDPVSGRIRRFAGTTVEGLRDGDVTEAFFAQTSGLAADGDKLWLADAETSALRWIEPAGDSFTVHTAIGVDLFSFGHTDGPADKALLQHPLGLAVLPGERIAIADTYNGAVRRFDFFTREVTTLATGLAEPQGLLLTDGRLLVVESAGNRIGPVPSGEPSVVTGDAHAVRRPPTVLAPGEVDFSVIFTAPPGEKLDDRFGPSTRLEISASPPELLADGVGAGTDLTRKIRFAPGVTEGVLQVVAQAASCDDGGEHPACRITRQDWGVPVRFEEGGASELSLVMAGEPRDAE